MFVNNVHVLVGMFNYRLYATELKQCTSKCSCVCASLQYGVFVGIGVSLLLLVYPIFRPKIEVRISGCDVKRFSHSKTYGNTGEQLLQSKQRHCIHSSVINIFVMNNY